MKNKPRILFEEVLGFLIFKKLTLLKKQMLIDNTIFLSNHII